jgi:hypothetical protein
MGFTTLGLGIAAFLDTRQVWLSVFLCVWLPGAWLIGGLTEARPSRARELALVLALVLALGWAALLRADLRASEAGLAATRLALEACFAGSNGASH